MGMKHLIRHMNRHGIGSDLYWTQRPQILAKRKEKLAKTGKRREASRIKLKGRSQRGGNRTYRVHSPFVPHEYKKREHAPVKDFTRCRRKS